MAEGLDQGRRNLPFNDSQLESAGTLLLLAGLIAVFQRSSEAVAIVGLVGLALGTVALVAVLVIRHRPWQSVVERAAIIGMIVGILGMLQHWDIKLYEYGFYLLFASTICFIAIMHVPVNDAKLDA